MTTHERELTAPVELCDRHGRLSPDATGWSRRPLHIANLRRAFGRKKRWDYWCVISDEVVVAITYADVDYVGLAGLWVLDRATEAQAGAGIRTPLGRGFDLPAVPCSATMHAADAGLSVTIADLPDVTHLLASVPAHPGPPVVVDLAVARPADLESMNVVIPWSDRKFQFTSKQVARPATGTVTVGDRTWRLDETTNAFGVLDLGRGIWPYSNRWNWAAASGHAVDGTAVGLQFGGKWTDGTGFTENAIVVDGRVSKIGEELEWTYDWEAPLRPWRVRTTASDQVDVTLTPTFDRYDHTDLKVVSMEVHQCFGTWAGRIVNDVGRALEIDGISGFAEEARNRW